MSAQPQRKQPGHEHHATSSHDTRIAVLETHWQDVVPMLATKADLADMRNEITAIRSAQDAQLRMTQELKTDYDKLDSALDSIHKIQGQFGYDLHKLNDKIDEQGRSLNDKIDAQTNKIIIRLGGVMLAIVTLACAVMTLLFSVMSSRQAVPMQPSRAAIVAPVQPVQPVQPAPAHVQPIQPPAPQEGNQ